MLAPASGEGVIPLAEEPVVAYERNDFRFELSGRVALEFVKYGHANDRRSGIELDAALLRFRGRYRRLRFTVEPDLHGVDARRHLYEASVGYDVHPAFRPRIGQFRIALSSGYGTREEHLPFGGYSFPAHLDGRYDIGIRADGEGRVAGIWYEVAGTVGEGYHLEGEERESPQVSARVVAHPARLVDPRPDLLFPDRGDDEGDPGPSELRGARRAFDGLFFGLAVAGSNDHDDPILVATPTESVVFRTRDLDGDGSRFVHFEAGYTYGPFLIVGERVRGVVRDVSIRGGGEEDIDPISR